MPKASKFSPDEGITIYDLKDSEAVHYGEQSKGYVGKNKLKISQTDRTNVDVTCKILDSNRMSINGTSTGSGAIPWNNEAGYDIDLVVGKSYKIVITILEGSMTIDSESSFYMNKSTTGNLGATNFTAGTFTVGKQFIGNTFVATESKTKGVQIWMNAAEVVFTNCIIGWMICDAEIIDTTFESYLTPNTEIFRKADNILLGSNNLHTNPSAWDTVLENGGITYTINNDGTLDLNGTATSNTDYVTHGRLINQPKPLYLPIGKYVCYLAEETEDFGWVEIATTYNNVYSSIMGGVSSNQIGHFEIKDTTNSDFKTPDGAVMISPHICVYKGITLNHKTVKLVIELESTYSGKFSSESMTNKQLTFDRPFDFKHSSPNGTTLSDLILGYINEYHNNKKLYSGKTITIAGGINQVGYRIVNMTHDNNRVMGYVITDTVELYIFHYNFDTQGFTMKKATLTSV